MKNFISFFLLLFPLWAFTQVNLQKTLAWEASPHVFSVTGTNEKVEIWKFEGATFDNAEPGLPYVVERFPVPTGAVLTLEVMEI